MDFTSEFCIMDYLSNSDIGFIFYPILGYGDAKYIGPAGAK